MRICYTAPILVVDDQPLMVDLTIRILRRLGFKHIDHERSGEKALANLRARTYQLVISDMHMQPLSGLQLLRLIRNDAALEGIHFLLMTGSVEPSIVVAARQAGADAYLLKPFTEAQLKAKLEEIFSRDRRF